MFLGLTVHYLVRSVGAIMIMLEDGRFVVTLMDMMVNTILLHWIQLLMAVLLSNALVRPLIQAIAMEMTTVIKTLGQIIARLVAAMEPI